MANVAHRLPGHALVLAWTGLLLAWSGYPSSVRAHEPGPALSQYVHRVWTSDEGLPQNSINAVLQTRDGYLWLGTQEGLTRFDGLHFTVFDRSNTEGLRSNYVWTLHEDRSGVLWVGTMGGGLSRIEGGVATTFTAADGLAGQVVHTIEEDAHGRVWVGTERGLSVFDGQAFHSYSFCEPGTSQEVRALLVDPDGSLWVGTREGVHHLSEGRCMSYGLEDGLPALSVHALYRGRDGTLWAGTGRGLAAFDGTRFEAAEPSGIAVLSLHEGRGGALWIGTAGEGLYRRQGRRVEGLGRADGLSDDYVASLFEDREGILWAGTFSGGLNQLKRGRFAAVTSAEGLSHDFVLSVLEGRDGSLWAGTYGGGLNRLRDGRITTFTSEDGLPSDVVTALWEDRSGALWVGTYGSGVARLHGGRFTRVGGRGSLPSPFIRALFEDGGGTLWVGTEAGLARRTARGFEAVPDVGDAQVQVIFEDSHGVRWFGTAGQGLYRLEGGLWTRYTMADGLTSDYVTALHEDAEGHLWIGTDGGGLNRLAEGRFAAVTTRDGLFDDVVFQILEDEAGGFWLSSNKGVFRVDRSALKAVMGGAAGRVHPRVFGRDDGLARRECNGRRQPSGWKGRDGRLWFATIGGVVSVDPKRVPSNELPPPVHVERFRVDDAELSAASVSSLAPGASRFEFHYTGLSLWTPEQIRFRYRLEGFDDGWIEAGARRVAYYTNLQSGSYRFHVQASNGDGVWNEAGARLDFRLRPAFYQTAWFFFSLLLAAVGVGTALYRVRLRRLRRRTEELQEAVRERTREILAQKEIAERASQTKTHLLQVVAHDLKSPLTGILGFAGLIESEVSPDAVVAEMASEIRGASERMLHLIEELLDEAALEAGGLVLSPEPVDLAALATDVLASFRGAAARKRQRLHLEAPEAVFVEADVRQIRKVLNNLVSNALKYSPLGKDVHLRVRETEAGVSLEVVDDGPGLCADDRHRLFRPFQRLSARPTGGETSTGLGLSIVKQIVDLHGGRVDVESTPGHGSRFVVELPKASDALWVLDESRTGP